MNYSEHLTNLCAEHICEGTIQERAGRISEIIAEMDDAKLCKIVDNNMDLLHVLMEEVRNWSGIQRKARNRADHDAAWGQTTEGEDRAYDAHRDGL